MIDPIDLEALLGWLRVRGARRLLLSYLAANLGDAAPAPPPRTLRRADRELAVEGLLHQCCDPRVDPRRLDGLAQVARHLGLDDAELRALISDRLGITERRLRAYAVLGLRLDATPDELKVAHRQVAKALHPDRLARADAEARAEAGRVLAKLNAARTLLLSPRDEVALDRPDDVGLGEPELDPSAEGEGEIELDDPIETEIDLGEPIEVDLTDLLEECR